MRRLLIHYSSERVAAANWDVLEANWCNRLLSDFSFLKGTIPRGSPDLLWMPLDAQDTEATQDDAFAQATVPVHSASGTANGSCLSPWPANLIAMESSLVTRRETDVAKGDALMGVINSITTALLADVVPLRYRWPVPLEFPLWRLFMGSEDDQIRLLRQAEKYNSFVQSLLVELWRMYRLEQSVKAHGGCVWRARYEAFVRGLVRYRCVLRSAQNADEDDTDRNLQSIATKGIVDVLVRYDGLMRPAVPTLARLCTLPTLL